MKTLASEGREYVRQLAKRARAGELNFEDESITAQLLNVADDVIETLHWLAKHRNEICKRYAAGRLAWPAYISPLKQIEKRSQALKGCIQLGRDYAHLAPNTTKVDTMFRVARFAVSRLNDPHDNDHGFYFATVIKRVEWLPREKCVAAIRQFITMHGKPRRKNWPTWKPVFERCITLNYGPSFERWKLFPVTPMPAKYRPKDNSLRIESWREHIKSAGRWGVIEEFIRHMVETTRIKPNERAELREALKRCSNRQHSGIMDVPVETADAALQKAFKRMKNRNGGWGEYKSEILKRCRRLLPP